MAANKNFLERSVTDDQDRPFETLTFNDVRHPDGGQGDWLSHILLGYVPQLQFNQMVGAPGWNPENMEVGIFVNGIHVIHATFESMLSEFSGRLLQERIKRGRWDSFEEAVKVKAGQLLRESIGTLQDNAYKLAENLEHLAKSSSTIVEQVWDAPFANHVDDAMRRAGCNAIELFGPVEPNDTHRAQLAERVYRAMNYARPEHLASAVKVTLPGVISDKSPPASREAGLIAQGRQQMLDEVMAALDAQGILFHRNPPPAEASGS